LMSSASVAEGLNSTTMTCVITKNSLTEASGGLEKGSQERCDYSHPPANVHGNGLYVDNTCSYRKCSKRPTGDKSAQVMDSTPADHSCTILAAAQKDMITKTQWLVDVGRFQPGEPAYISIVSQGSTDATELSTADEKSTRDPSEPSGGKMKPSRPCKGKRMRYTKFVERLKSDISANPETFSIESVIFPPSLEANKQKKERLINHMMFYQDNVKANDCKLDLAMSESVWVAL